MNSKLASVSTITLGLMLGAPAFGQAQDAQPADGQPDAIVIAPAPGPADAIVVLPEDEDDPEAPEVAADPAIDQEPDVAAGAEIDPEIDPDAPDVAADPAIDPDAPEVATEPEIHPDTPEVATDPATDTIEPDVAADPDAALEPDVAADPATEPAEPDLAADPDAEIDPDAPEFAARHIGFEEMDELLGDAGIEDRELFFGSVVRSQTEDGEQIVMLVGAENFQPGEGDAAGPDEFTALQDELGEAGLEQVRQDIDWLVMQGRLDGHAVFALSADPAGRPATDEEHAAETALDRDALRDKLGEAGIEADDDIDVKVFRASTDDGGRIFLLVGPENFEAGGSVDLSEDDIRERLEDAGLSDVELLEDDIHFVRADREESAILAVSSRWLHENGATAEN